MSEKPSMSDKYDQQIEKQVLELAASVVNDQANAKQVADLDALLTRHQEARSCFLQYVNIHAALRQRFLTPADQYDNSSVMSDESPAQLAAPATATAPNYAARWFVGGMVLAASLMVAIGVAMRSPDKQAKPQPSLAATLAAQGNHHAALNGVAVLSKTVDVIWASNSLVGESGKPLPAGKLAIESGLLQLEFYSGAVAILEGPATIDLMSPDRAFLHSGKLRTVVPPQAKGFTIGLASGDVVDLGTEFAIEVPPDGPSQVHVLDGEVEYQDSLTFESAPKRLLEGQAIELADAVSQMGLLASDSNRFIGPAELEALAQKHHDRRNEQWLEHRQRLQQDPALVAHYTFDATSPWSRTLMNRAPDASNDSHGAIVGCEWSSGRWPGQKSLRFQNASHRVRVNIPGEFDALTLATWVQIDNYQELNKIALIHPDASQQRFVHWTIDRTVDGALMHFAETSIAGGTPDRCHYTSGGLPLVDADLHRWVHLAVVYNPVEERVSHYAHGKLIGWLPLKKKRQLGVGVANLGNWPYRDWAKGTRFEVRNLIGKMDEFTVLSRALGDDEIREMYVAGNPERESQ